jgi:hypothetical protein
MLSLEDDHFFMDVTGLLLLLVATTTSNKCL